MSAQATRLESLFLLVRDGSSAQVRENAAEKLGEVAARSPEICASILQKLRPLIVDDEWEIRVAASKCLNVVARSLRTEDENVATVFALVSLGSREALLVALDLQTVDVYKVVKEGAPLLRSGGEEYQYTTNMTEEVRRVQAIKQRRLLLRRLSGIGEPIWNSREGSLTKQLLPRLNQAYTHEIADDIEKSEAQSAVGSEHNVPAVQENKASEIMLAFRSSKRSSESDDLRHNKKRILGETDGKAARLGTESTDKKQLSSLLQEAEMQTKTTIVACLVSDLFESMFDSKWEVRHGALLSLRQIFISTHFTAAIEAARQAQVSTGTRESVLDKWLEECLVRCICVLALDRFVDYSADGSISPVREVCAQVFGLLLGSVSGKSMLVRYLQVVRTLFSGLTWHACHGALLGLKYLVRAHCNHGLVLVPLFFNDIVTVFSQAETEEDVSILAADMIRDFVFYLDQVEPAAITKTATLLWKSMELHEKVGLIGISVVQALSAWYNHSPVAWLLQRDKGVNEALWQNLSYTIPMLHHPLQSVRVSSATCAAAILSCGSTSMNPNVVCFGRAFLPHLLLQVRLEKHEPVQRSLLSTWKRVVSTLSNGALLVDVVAEYLPIWAKLLWSTDEMHCLDAKVIKSDGMMIDANVSDSIEQAVWESMTSCVAFAKAIGLVAAHMPYDNSCTTELIQLFHDGVRSRSGNLQCSVLLALSNWGIYEKKMSRKNLGEHSRRLQWLQSAVGTLIESFVKCQWKTLQLDTQNEAESAIYSEQRGSLKRVMQMEARIVDLFSSVGIALKPSKISGLSSTADISRQIAEHVALFPYDKLRNHPKEYEQAHFKRQDLFLVDERVQHSFSRLYHRVQGLGSTAYYAILPTPKKCGFLVSALMTSIKNEDEPAIRSILSRTIADFVVNNATTQKKCVSKIVVNLCNNAVALVGVSDVCPDGVFTYTGCEDSRSPSIAPEILKQTKARVVGANSALREICKCGGASLFEACHALEDAISKAWTHLPLDELTIQRCMRLIGIVVPHLEGNAMATCLAWIGHLAQLTQQQYEDKLTRRVVAQAVATISKYAEKRHRTDAMLSVYSSIFVVFSNTGNANARRKEALEGAVMVLSCIVQALGADLAPYVPSLVHFAMKTMSSQFEHVRSCAAGAFADLVPLIPLQMDLELRESEQLLPDSLRTIVKQNAVSRTFLDSFAEGKAIEQTNVKPLLACDTSLRLYQQHGVDWLCFMIKNNLHGILADDMGLGKTLQTLSAMAATSVSSATNGGEVTVMPYLIVCPPIVTHHWIQEVNKHVPEFFASIIDYSVSASERKSLLRSDGRSLSDRCPTLIVTTYSILRADIQLLGSIDYAFVVLDEAHLIRNPSTALFQAVRKLQASHRVALSGTPLQNNVTDLWALFEFLMPGYLGDFAAFRREFVLPITKSAQRNATTKQKEMAAVAIARLHQKVLPFILRRTKDEVLKELPPKIISNVLLPLSPLQQRLYSLTSSTESESMISARCSRSTKPRAEKMETKINVLANLQLLRKICVHPALVANDKVARSLNATEKETLWDWKCSGKMMGLRDLLVECCDVAPWDQGLSQSGTSDTRNLEASEVSPHRCLVFAHLQQTLDFTEQMLQDALPTVTYRRLDGRTPPAKRADIVQCFNSDPSIDILLLTTSVGGLGLTLTGADTVIFIEHSWNPFVDLQAMDRAHRIGQKRSVRVFRLIMEGSLEEHIVNLQEFKEQVAATVVQTSDARSSMNTSTKGVLNLLRASSSAMVAKELRRSVSTRKSGEIDRAAAALPQGAKELIDQIGELWDESQYESLAFPDVICE
uniref:Uncharacterized protein n=1 Tax=Peronospora matthiolae TaxID=2874970 RepID=A0AAV1U6L3_9STRA